MIKRLHITNGGNLTEALKALHYQGDIITWNEMLCEGPTYTEIDSETFYDLRKGFFKQTYAISSEDYQKKFISEIEKLNNTSSYQEIILWFEYDLFCHINLIAAISLLKQKNINLPLFLVCSGRVQGEKDLKGLSELTPQQLQLHYDKKVKLSDEDIEMALTIWRAYCSNDHSTIKPFITKSSSFKYLSNCLKAHLERFPNTENGLCNIENNLLSLIDKYEIKSKHQLLGYALQYQGFYGYGDTQLKRIIDKLDLFIDDSEEYLKLNKKGQLALQLKYNFSKELAHQIAFGGADRLDYQFDSSLNKLFKIM